MHESLGPGVFALADIKLSVLYQVPAWLSRCGSIVHEGPAGLWCVCLPISMPLSSVCALPALDQFMFWRMCSMAAFGRMLVRSKRFSVLQALMGQAHGPGAHVHTVSTTTCSACSG